MVPNAAQLWSSPTPLLMLAVELESRRNRRSCQPTPSDMSTLEPFGSHATSTPTNGLAGGRRMVETSHSSAKCQCTTGMGMMIGSFSICETPSTPMPRIMSGDGVQAMLAMPPP